jgi:hypothetical protein
MTHVSEQPKLAVETRHLYDMVAVTEVPLRTVAPLGIRSTSLVRAGTITGERITGRMLPGGGDWMLFDAEMVGHIDVRYAIETDDGAIIQVSYNGRLAFHGDALQRFRDGQQLAEDDYYLRIAPTFEAPAAYGWLNQVQAIGMGIIQPGTDGGSSVRYRIHEIL